MFPSTVERVPVNTCPSSNAHIENQTQSDLMDYELATSAQIQKRLNELDHEWDVERILEANASTVILTGLGLGAFVDKRFFALPVVVAGFLLQHAIQGWCPPLPILRRLGIRTQPEIEQERYTLKLMRGDFKNVDSDNSEESFCAIKRS